MLPHDLGGPLKRTYHRARGADVSRTSHIAFGSRLSSRTSVGENTWINGAATCKGGGSISIGAHCAIGQDLLVTTTNHEMRFANMMLRTHWDHGFVDLEGSGDVAIGPAGWIGDRVTVLADTRIGVGAVIAAGALVTRGDYPDYCVLAGVPARVVRMRATPEVASVLVGSQWWTWPDERVGRNRAFFETDIGTADAGELRATILD